MTRFCLIRHGQTEWNLAGRYQGQSDVPLNEKGRAQARALAWQFRKLPFAAVYSSDLQRARETAEIIAAALHLPVTADIRLREINQGEWEGQLVETIAARYAALWRQRQVDPAGIRPPGGETVEEVARRARAALQDISRLHPDDSILISSHGLTLATVICQDRHVPIGRAYSLIPENATPVWVEWKANGPAA
ncbi:MAG: histidine phosphatase family protein [Hyphomicrobiales bacterium]